MTNRDSDVRGLSRRRAEPPVWAFGDLIIRRYRSADHEAVLALHHDGLAQVGLRPGDGVYYDHDFPALKEIYLDNGGEFVIGRPARITGRLTGQSRRVLAMGGLRRVDERTAEMVRLRVHPDVQRRGYGAAIVLALEERAIELGYRLLQGDTTDLQGPALALYERFGWRETRREVICGIVNIYGEKELPPP
ncbi:GNAT family N-acetyltransferase [Actinomadura sp. HBU206391]|uniref:GNAT family N-acetyltransferase n=1 Tax=Actinomadura sp. HBU206391 TaxID=2731692 RepID=UPI00164F3AE5|nr:GNAT family N-acetyltransferase [Actinomadura sp. HBU206391]MBC6458714.1 GNAT family N-acetyltransferase [Actinomadura sp. HBU206391]